MRSVPRETVLGTLATPVLLGVLSLVADLGAAGWAVGLASGWAATGLLTAGRARRGEPILPPDRVTLTRAVLTAGVAALVAGSAGGPLPVGALVPLAAGALVLDAVDGRVARRTGTATPFGARLDGEVDAYLILVLSVAVSREYGAWVLAIGAARYVLLAAGWAVRWLRAPLPYRYWAKVVAAVQGVVLTVAASGVLPRPVGLVAVTVALVLLTESFGRSVVWLFRAGAGPRTRTAVRWGSALAAGAVVWAALVLPPRLDLLTPGAFARIPLEGLVLVAVGLVLPARARRGVAAGAGIVLGLLVVLKLLDVGFTAQLGRRFDLVVDWSSFGPAIGAARDVLGTGSTDVVLVLVGLVVALLVAVVAASAVRLTGVTARHRHRTARGLAGLGVVWAVCAALSLQLAPAGPVASASSAALAVQHGRDVSATLAAQRRFEEASRAPDTLGGLSGPELLSSLRGTDVFVVFVESYGEVALIDPGISPGVASVLRDASAALDRAGMAARSAWLDSPTFGGLSWLAHATLQSGLWVDNQVSYDRLMAGDRLTLFDAFGSTGWRTVGVNPAHEEEWQEGAAFYGLDHVYDKHGLGYTGPKFGWAPVPDQFTLAAFERLELAPGHDPVMAQIDLVSSHWPWTPLPRMVPDDALGDGSVYDPMPAEGLSAEEVLADPGAVRRLYGESIEYSLEALLTWVARQDDVVIVLLGDHQPITAVTGPVAGTRVPVTIVASDPAVLDLVESWEWQGGLVPGADAPEWPMDAFRDRFLDAFTPGAGQGDGG
ncbi:CDP-alcohol phosphatidyltransferase family protein [Trujillonella humicola]|uniref:CDP-alcohol phosphatidyltransferase family protein n=1 Tax=Trujillonella humicola TaxID=3383699 RepID=UPI003906B68B